MYYTIVQINYNSRLLYNIILTIIRKMTHYLKKKYSRQIFYSCVIALIVGFICVNSKYIEILSNT